MAHPDAPPLQVIAMHGWSGEARHWAPWQQAAAARGWTWQSGERGYGEAPPWMPLWAEEGLRVVIAHSLGLQLLPQPLLERARPPSDRST